MNQGAQWSIEWSTISYDKILIANGSFNFWMIFAKGIPEPASGNTIDLTVDESSFSGTQYTSNIYNNPIITSDPAISIQDSSITLPTNL